MSKPLELTVYPPLAPDDELRWRDVSTGREGQPSDVPVPEWHHRQRSAPPARYGKRLTDAELAAEYWRANSIGWCAEATQSFYDEFTGHIVSSDRMKHYVTVLDRFATHPHYDEETTDE